LEPTPTQIKKAVPLAKELNVKISIENVWNNFILSPLEAVRFLDEVGDPIVGWHFDIGNVLRYGWPEHWIKVLGKRINRIHVKEYSTTKMKDEGVWKGFEVDLTEGTNNWPAIMKALDDVGYTGWAISEQRGGINPNGLKMLTSNGTNVYMQEAVLNDTWTLEDSSQLSLLSCYSIWCFCKQPLSRGLITFERATCTK
jgi:hexulose-6-phosphate isomerase